MNILLLFSCFPIKDPTWIFFIVLTIILFMPLLMGKLRIPHIIGMILAGIVIGEHGFNILVRDSSFELFGKVGLYYIMFLAGLELNLQEFKRNKGKGILFGLLTFFIPFATGMIVGVYFLHFSVLASLLLSCIFSSHTLVSYPIVTRYGLGKHPSVVVSVGATMIALTLALLVLAAIAGSGESMDFMFWILFIVKCTAFILLSVFFIPRIARWFFRKYEDNVMQYIFVLSVVFLCAGMASLAGLDGIFGAFLAGLLLNRLIPYVSPLMSRIEFVGNALFIPYFLIGVGMLINIEALFNGGNTLKIIITMILVATLTKGVAAWIVQKIFRMDGTSRLMMFGLTDAHAAGALAMVMVGTTLMVAPNQYLMSDDILNGVIIMILFSCIISSFATQQAARSLALSKATGESDSLGLADEKIMISLSNPNTVSNLVNIALMVRNQKLNKELVGLHVVCDADRKPDSKSVGNECLLMAEKIAAAADVSMQMQSRVGTNVVSGILHTVEEREVTDVIIGLHHKMKTENNFFGKFAHGLLQGTNRQIIIVSCRIPVNTLRQILVVVPPKAEYEAGFYKWVERLSMMGEQLGCRVRFFGQPETLQKIQRYVHNKHENVRGEYIEMDSWDDLSQISGQLNDDHLLVLVSARWGAISYQSVFENLSQLLEDNFPDKNIMVIYPDQFGNPQDITFTSGLLAYRESRSTYDMVYKWFYRFFKKI